MTARESKPNMDPGIVHNEVLQQYYQKHPITRRSEVTVPSFQAILQEAGAHLTEKGFSAADVQSTLEHAAKAVPAMKVFESGKLPASSQELLPLLATDVISSGRLSKPLAEELQRLAKLDSSTAPTRPQLPVASRPGTLQDDTLVIETFNSVGAAAYDFWTDPTRIDSTQPEAFKGLKKAATPILRTRMAR